MPRTRSVRTSTGRGQVGPSRSLAARRLRRSIRQLGRGGELSHEPELVASALDALADRAKHWTLVSTVSVYADNSAPGADETAELVEPQDLTAYDVADLAAWLAEASHAGVHAVVDAVGHSHTMAEFFAAACAVTGFDGELVAVEDEDLLARDINYWAGARSLPLWLPEEAGGLARRDPSGFLALGGSVRPLAETLARTLTDEINRGLDRKRRSGLSRSEEEQVLVALG